MKRKFSIFSSYLLTLFTITLSRTSLAFVPIKIRLYFFFPFLQTHSPFYRTIKELPIMNKALWMKNFDRINTVGVTLAQAENVALAFEKDPNLLPFIDQTTVLFSTGTSGNRGIQLTRSHEQNTWTGAVLAKLLPHSIFQTQKIALFLRANSQIYETINSTKIRFEYFPLGHDLKQQKQRLEAYQPDIIVAPPSMLKLMSAWRIHPQKVISCAEVLSPEDRQFLEKSFQQKLHEIYQCTEGFLGATCKEGNMHLNEDLVRFEKVWIDQDSRRFNILITDPQRRTQPVVRYSLNDILVEASGRCPCGSRFTWVERIEGRCDDIFHLADGSLVFPDHIRRAVVSASPTIEEYRVTQKAADLILIQLKTSRPQDVELVRISIRQLFESLTSTLPSFEFSDYDEDPVNLKKRRIKRDFL